MNMYHYTSSLKIGSIIKKGIKPSKSNYCAVNENGIYDNIEDESSKTPNIFLTDLAPEKYFKASEELGIGISKDECNIVIKIDEKSIIEQGFRIFRCPTNEHIYCLPTPQNKPLKIEEKNIRKFHDEPLFDIYQMMG